jgi:hypothetical protein
LRGGAKRGGKNGEGEVKKARAHETVAGWDGWKSWEGEAEVKNSGL